jgi:lipopolysaccharide transport system permease protein
LDEAGGQVSTELETRTEQAEVAPGSPVPDRIPLPELEIKPPGRFSGVGLREIWAYRELLYFLTKRELQIRYKQSYLGFAWAIVQPVALTFIFALFFGRLAGLSSEGIPYPVYALAGLVPWIFTSGAVSGATGSLVIDANLIGKVYFPRAAIPVAKMLSLVIDLIVAFVFLILFALVYSVSLHWTAVYIPLFVALDFATVLGVGLFLSALNVRYRDVFVAIPLLVQLWLFVSPVVYSGALVTGWWRYVYALNPMASVLTGFRWALFGTHSPGLGPVLVSTAVALMVLVGASLYFRRVENYFADVI